MNNDESKTYIISHFKKEKFEFKKTVDSKKICNLSINSSKLFKNNKYKEFFYQGQKIIDEKQKSYSSRNKKNNKKNITDIKSTIIKTQKGSQINLFSALLSKTNKTKNHFRDQLKRNYSAYYINSDFRLKKKYIYDLLLKKEDKSNQTQKISDIEKKINTLEKMLNIKKNNPIYEDKSFKLKQKEDEENSKEKDLPDYLKKKFKIKGTNILSPFCMKSRDKFIMEKFKKFLSKGNTLKTDCKYIIDNKLNIIYAENEETYQNKLKKINQKLISQGKRERYKYIFSPSERQLRDIGKKVTFMKDIVNVAYSNINLLRLKDTKLYLKKYKTFYKKFETLNDRKNEEIDEVKNDFFEIKIKQ
jgi:hypothetical protein